jgi:Integrase core domain
MGSPSRTRPRRNSLTCSDATSPLSGPNAKWVGDITEIPTVGGKLYLATVIDLFSRRLLGAATSAHPDAELAVRRSGWPWPPAGVPRLCGAMTNRNGSSSTPTGDQPADSTGRRNTSIKEVRCGEAEGRGAEWCEAAVGG